MSRIRPLSSLVVAAAAAGGLVAGTALTARSQDPGEDMMKKWAELAAPGAKHAEIVKLAGDWDVTSRVWMGGPGSPAMESKGTMTIEPILGGRFVRFHGSCDFMGRPCGQDGYLGYDTFRKRYVGTFLNGMSTAILTVEGGPSQDGKAFHMYGKLDEFLDGTVGKNVRVTFRFPSPDRFVVESHDLDIGETNTKVLEYEYARRK